MNSDGKAIQNLQHDQEIQLQEVRPENFLTNISI